MQELKTSVPGTNEQQTKSAGADLAQTHLLPKAVDARHFFLSMHLQNLQGEIMKENQRKSLKANPGADPGADLAKRHIYIYIYIYIYTAQTLAQTKKQPLKKTRARQQKTRKPL